MEKLPYQHIFRWKRHWDRSSHYSWTTGRNTLLIGRETHTHHGRGTNENSCLITILWILCISCCLGENILKITEGKVQTMDHTNGEGDLEAIPLCYHQEICSVMWYARSPSCVSKCIYCRVPARWGLQQTTRAPDSDGLYFWLVFTKTGWTWHVTLPLIYCDFIPSNVTVNPHKGTCSCMWHMIFVKHDNQHES